MGLKAVHPAGNAKAAKCSAPGDGLGFVARRGRERIRRSRAPADEAVNLFLDVDERLFHDAPSLGVSMGEGKLPVGIEGSAKPVGDWIGATRADQTKLRETLFLSWTERCEARPLTKRGMRVDVRPRTVGSQGTRPELHLAESMCQRDIRLGFTKVEPWKE